VLVTTSLRPNVVVPYRMIDVTVSGTSIIVLRTAHLLVVARAFPLIFPQWSAWAPRQRAAYVTP
jgi:hypothetical protein